MKLVNSQHIWRFNNLIAHGSVIASLIMFSIFRMTHLIIMFVKYSTWSVVRYANKLFLLK